MSVKPPVGKQVNRSHPLARGLVSAWLFNEGAGTILQDLSGYKNNGTLAIGQWETGCLTWDTNLSFTLPITRDSLTLPEGWSVVMGFKTRDTDKAQVSYVSGGVTYYRESASTVNDGYYHVAVGIYDGSDAADSLTLYVDGAIDQGAQTGFGAADANVGTLTFDAAAGTGVFSEVYVYERALAASEVRELYIDPYSFFDPLE